MFTIYDDTKTGSTVVSNLFIDNYMKDANDAQIKIYLYLLRQLGAGRATSIADMADEFNHTEKDVIRSLRYWEKKGLLSIDTDSKGNLCGVHVLDAAENGTARQDSRIISIAPALEERVREEREAGVSSDPVCAENARSSRNTAENPSCSASSEEDGNAVRFSAGSSRDAVDAEALRAFRENKNRRDLLFVVEQYVGKPLSASELRTICFISGNLKFSDDLIDYLVQYCVDRGKKDFRYIEKVAVNWAENGITTPKQAAAQTNSAPRAGGKKAGKNGTAGSFGSFEQRSYDWNELEKKILGG